jgi:hypothetical protein
LEGSGTSFLSPRSLLIDSDNNRALVGDGSPDAGTLFSVDLTTGLRTVISDLDTPQTDFELIGARSMVSDELQEYVLIDTSASGIVKVDLISGERSQFLSTLSNNPAFPYHYFHLEDGAAYMIYLDEATRALYAIDMESKDIVIMSKSETSD